jgi:glycosyltransferase involved in cell wall biosynthesis
MPSKIWPFPFAAAILRLFGTLKSVRAELVHVNEHDHHPVAAYAARWAGIPIFTHMRFRPGPEYCRWLFRSGRRPDRLFFTSNTQMHDSADAVRPMVPEHLWRVLPNGLDFSTYGIDTSQRDRVREAWGLGAETFALGIACAISSRKRVDHFIRLVARLRGAGVDARGFIAGQTYFSEDEEVLKSLRQLVAELGIESSITFLGYVEPSEPLYHAWDLCVSTSQYETFGMTVLEAMGCSCPVVTYPGGSVAEIVGQAACVVPDGDEHALFEASFAFAQDPAARRSLGATGRLHASACYDIRTLVPALAHEYTRWNE